MQRITRQSLAGILLFVMGVGVGSTWARVRNEGVQWGGVPFVGESTTSTGRVIGIGQSPRIPLAEDVEFALFWRAWQKIRDTYYEKPVSDKDLFYGALSGLAAGAGDSYTTFFPPKEAEDFSNQLDGKFEGIGAQIEVKNGQLQVVAPLDESPAEKAGLRPGDVIATIEGKSTEGLTVDVAAERIRGPKGTPVNLTILRDTARAPFALTIIRDEIRLKSVKLSWEGDLAILTISSFGTDTPALFADASQEIRAKKAKGLIVDLRNNPGGSVHTAQVVGGAWIGDQVLFRERRQGKIVESVKGIGRGELSGIPLVVLINEGSASASEILAGALEDYGKGTTMGATTFGKGSVQEYEELPDGSALKITVAEWITPKDRVINHVGVRPMVGIPQTEQDYVSKRDPQLDGAKQFLREGKLPPTASSSTTP